MNCEAIIIAKATRGSDSDYELRSNYNRESYKRERKRLLIAK